MTATKSRFNQEMTIEEGSDAPRKFRTPQSVMRWADHERKFWDSITERCNQRSLFANDFDVHDLAHHANFLARQCKAYMETTDDSDRLSTENEIRVSLKAYERPEFLVSNAPESEVINRLADTDPNAAWLALVHARKQKYRIGHVQNIDDLIRAWEVVRLSRLDVEVRLECLEHGLKRMRSRWDDRLRTTENASLRAQKVNRRRVRLYRKAAQRLILRHGSAQEEHRVRMEEMQRVHVARVEEIQTDHEARMEKMRQAYSTEMTLRASEKFWSRKRNLNRKRARKAFKKLAWSGVLGAITLAGIFLGLHWTIGLPEGLGIVHGLWYLVPSVLYLWLLKIFANEYRTNTDLADDAEEREAMVFTFKALEHEERVGTEERLLILNALFRPHERGSEESMPLPAWEAMVKRLNR